ncbi:hypothetical protein Tco_1289103 [Tanacetum coccineum]
MKTICKLDVPVVSKAPKPSLQTEEVPQGKKPGAKSRLRRKKSSKHTSESQTKAFKSKTGQSEIETKSSSAKDKSPSHPSPPTPVDMDEGTKNYSFDHILAGFNPSILVDKTKSARDGLKNAHINSGTNKEYGILKRIKLEDLSKFLKDTRSAFFTPDSSQDDPIIVTDESKEEEADKEYIHDTYHDVPEDTSVPPPPSPKSAQIQELMAQAKLSKLLASHNFASCLSTKLKKLSSKFTKLSGKIKELKQHVKDMEIELPGDLKEIPTKLETFTSSISIQKQLKTLDSLPSLLNKVTETLNRFATVVENASEATTKDIPSASQATNLPTEGDKNTKDAETNLKDELVDLLSTNVMTQYYNKKLLFDKYRDKMLKRRKAPRSQTVKFSQRKAQSH